MKDEIRERTPQSGRFPIDAVAAATLSVLVFYTAFTVIGLAVHGWDPFWFVWTGERYAHLTPGGTTGYDGQFSYYIARYGGDAIPHLDNPPYRLQRILYPAVLFLLSLGKPDLIPWMMIAVNLIAIALTTRLLAQWLQERDLSPWYALAYALYVGTFMAYSRDLTEPLAFYLAALGIVLWFRGRPKWAVAVLALALLAKEITLLFVFGLIASSLVGKKPKEALLAALASLPLAAWQGCLFLKFGAFPMTAGPPLERIPLNGIIPHLSFEPGRLSAFLFVGLPGLALLFASLHYLSRGGGHPERWWLLLQSLFVVLMPLATYDHIMAAGRNGCGLVLSALFLFPIVNQPLRVLSMCCWILPTLVWMIPVWIMAPWHIRA